MLNTKFPPWPSFTDKEATRISKILKSNRVNYWTGEETKLFEQEFAEFVGVRHSIAVANGTVALDLAFRAIDLKPGDKVIVTSRTFIASVSSIINLGGEPIFIDVCKNSQNIMPELIRKKISKKVKAILCVHLSGWPCEMDEIMNIAKKNNLFVIEDCAQAHGAKYKNRSVGSIGDIGCWSFCQDKIMTTGGEGGMITTNKKKFWQRMWSYKDHGKSYSEIMKTNPKKGFRWLHNSFGTNYRLTEMQSGIGRIQLKQLDLMVRRRSFFQDLIWKESRNIEGIRTPNFKCNSCFGCNKKNGCRHAAYKCYVFIEKDKLKSGWNRDRICEEISNNGVPCFSGSCSEVYLEKAFDKKKYKPKKSLNNAKELGETSLMFLVHPTLDKKHILKTIDSLKKVMKQAINK